MALEIARISQLKCSEQQKSRLSQYARELTDVLAGNLIGVYLYGSLARGCYHHSTSDIDILVVTRLPCPEDILNAILEVHRRSALQTDAVFVTETQLGANICPALIDFLVKPISGYQVVRKPEGRNDFLLQRQDAYEAGINLIGPIPANLMNPVPWELLAQSLDFLLPHIVVHFKNPVLMLCRIVHAWQNRKLCCKQQAGEWALEALDPRWVELIRNALNEYAGGLPSGSESTQVREFEAYCQEHIRALRG